MGHPATKNKKFQLTYNKYIFTFFLSILLSYIKILNFPIFWPGGDYLNHIQNAREILYYNVHWSYGVGGYNAWWQPIGPAIYMLLNGFLLFKNFYIYIFFQSL